MRDINKAGEKKIGLAIAGLGFGESVHLPAIKSSSKFNLIALWHPNKERLNKSCNIHSVKGYTEWKDVLEDSRIEAIIIATPPEIRFELSIEALKYGKHLLLEKPVALNSQQVAEIQRVALSKRLSIAVDFEYRCVPLFMQTKKLLENNCIGSPWLIKLDWLMSSRANPSRHWNWYSEGSKGGGVIGALGTHAFDMLHWLIGPSESISALLSTSIKERKDLVTNRIKSVSSEDIALIQLKLKAEDTIVPAQITLSSVSRQGRGCWIEIYGQQGTLLLGSDNQSDYVHGFGLWFAPAGEKLQPVNPDPEIAFRKTWTDGRVAPVAKIQDLWAESIKSGLPMIPGLYEGLASQRACDSAKDSAQTGMIQ